MRKGTKLALIIMLLALISSAALFFGVIYLGLWMFPIIVIILFFIVSYIFNKEY